MSTRGGRTAFPVSLLFCAALAISLIAAPAPSLIRADDPKDATTGYSAPVRLANLENQDIKESSGIAASQRQADIMWTHNDSGDGPLLYAIDRQGKHRGVWRVLGAKAQDWEDLALGPGPKRGQSYLYVGDIGDNLQKRAEIAVYRVAEPEVTPHDATSTVKKPSATAAADVFRLKYPDGRHNAETLLVHPLTGDLYIVTKVSGPVARVYNLPAQEPKQEVLPLTFVGELRLPKPHLGMLTGGSVSPSGNRVVLCDYLSAYEFTLPAKPGTAFDEIWKQTARTVALGSYPGTRRQGEAICYRADGRALLATSEGLPCPLIEVAEQKRDR